MNEIVWPTIDSKHLIVDSKQMLILEKEMFSDGMPQEALMEKAGIQISRSVSYTHLTLPTICSV